MNCKKDPHEKCLCVKRKHGGCVDCEKSAIKIVKESGRDLNETIKLVKETDAIIDDLYIAVDDFACGLECCSAFVFRSAIDILRGVCDYCKRRTSKACDECMWSNMLNGNDRWFFAPNTSPVMEVDHHD